MPIDPTTTNLEAKDYSGRDLRGINLAYHRCMHANFTGADLRGVSFVGADCTGANFEGANLEGADFTGAIVNDAKLPPGDYKFGGALFRDVQPATIEVAPLVRVKVLEEDNKRLEDDNVLLRQQLDDALAEIRRLTTPEQSDQSSDLLMEEDRPAPTRRKRSAEQ